MTLSLASAAADTVAAGIFFAVAAFVADAAPKRKGADAASDATLFVLAWIGMAVYASAAAALDLGVLYGSPLLVATALRFAQIAALAIGLWGFACHVAFVLTGRRAFVVELAALYAAYYGVATFAAVIDAPVAGPAQGGAVTPDVTLAGVLVLPALVSGITLAALSAERVLLRHRARVALLALGVVGYHASLIARQSPDASALGPIPTSAGLIGVACVLLAYTHAWGPAASRGSQAATAAEDPDAP